MIFKATRSNKACQVDRQLQELTLVLNRGSEGPEYIKPCPLPSPPSASPTLKDRTEVEQKIIEMRRASA